MKAFQTNHGAMPSCTSIRDGRLGRHEHEEGLPNLETNVGQRPAIVRKRNKTWLPSMKSIPSHKVTASNGTKHQSHRLNGLTPRSTSRNDIAIAQAIKDTPIHSCLIRLTKGGLHFQAFKVKNSAACTTSRPASRNPCNQSTL